jgi:hypothetical protein
MKQALAIWSARGNDIPSPIGSPFPNQVAASQQQLVEPKNKTPSRDSGF